MQKLTYKKFKLGKVPEILFPTLLYKGLSNEYKKIIDEWYTIVSDSLDINIERIVRESKTFNDSAFTDSYRWTESVQALINEIKFKFAGTLRSVGFQADTKGRKIGDWNNKEWRKVVNKTLKRDIFTSEPGIKDKIQSFVQSNIALIKNLSEETANKIQSAIISGIQQGKDHLVIKTSITKKGMSGEKGRFKKVKDRADLIARDQVSKLNSQLTQLRQVSLGVTRYIWRTRKDIRVRGNPGGKYPDSIPSHWDREGKFFKWSDPPEGGHPGFAINCRCWPEPVLEDILPNMNAYRKGYNEY